MTDWLYLLSYIKYGKIFVFQSIVFLLQACLVINQRLDMPQPDSCKYFRANAYNNLKLSG